MTLAARAGAPTGSGWDVRFADAVRVDSSHGVSTFRARDTETGRFVEIRLAARTTPAAYERLVREAEVQARVGSHPNVHTMFERLDAPVRRVAALDTFVGYNPALEDEILPQTSDIADALRSLAAY